MSKIMTGNVSIYAVHDTACPDAIYKALEDYKDQGVYNLGKPFKRLVWFFHVRNFMRESLEKTGYVITYENLVWSGMGGEEWGMWSWWWLVIGMYLLSISRHA
jgi:hypothetical protein